MTQDAPATQESATQEPRGDGAGGSPRSDSPRSDGPRGGPRGGGPRGGGGRGRGRGRGRGFRRRGDYFKQTGEPIDYKNSQLLRRFIADSGRIESRRKTGITAKN
ncbi:MAG: ribosomal protein S18, partial [Chloroflexota bacterium]|nr:ribosomal protein S18 [Chloroflexota bacterium]